jgi:hypothetical protein
MGYYNHVDQLAFHIKVLKENLTTLSGDFPKGYVILRIIIQGVGQTN